MMSAFKYFLLVILAAVVSFAGQGMVVPPDCAECQALLASGNATLVNSSGVLNAANLSSVMGSRTRPANTSPSGQGKVIK